METLIVEIKNKKARKILEDLQDLDLINLVSEKKQKIVDLSQYYNLLTPKEGLERLTELKRDREEWEERNT